MREKILLYVMCYANLSFQAVVATWKTFPGIRKYLNELL